MITELKHEVSSVLRNIMAAQAAQLPYETYLHRKYLQTLLDTAGTRGIDTTGWVDRSTLPPPNLVEGPFTLDEM